MAVSTQTVELTDGVRARFRLGELVYADGTSGFEPNLVVPASDVEGEQNSAFQAAIQLAKAGKFSTPSRKRLTERPDPLRDNAYDDLQYPPAEYRVLAAFRVWAVINYFFPIKSLWGRTGMRRSANLHLGWREPRTLSITTSRSLKW